MAPGLRLLRAPNPSPMTERGTNTYLLGTDEIAVIDPGPQDAGHLRTILDATGGGKKIRQIWVTHSHLDHSALAPALSSAADAPILAYGTSDAGRAEHMRDLAHHVALGGGEGVHTGFVPDQNVPDGATLEIDGIRATAHWTPGHFCNHLVFETPLGTFTGDLIMGWASSLVSPPDGDLTAYMASLELVEATQSARLFSGHGDVIETPQERISWLRQHRKSREAAILAALGDRPTGLLSLTGDVYADVPRHMHRAAARNLLAHLIDLHLRGRVIVQGHHGVEGQYRLA